MKISLVGRSSRLSVAQLNYVAKLLQDNNPNLDVEIVTTKTKGDIITNQPLHQLQDIGYFTKEIDQYLLDNKADIAVHCLKDVGTERPDGIKTISIFNRQNPRDILIYSPRFLEKIKNGETCYIGTSSLRREELAYKLFPQILPRMDGQEPKIKIKDLRGNIETRLRAVKREEDDPKYCDAIILAIAGLNRILTSEENRALFLGILEGTDSMLLPLSEFPCAPGQGAICLEVNTQNKDALEVAKSLNDKNIETQVLREREILGIYGGGCHQKFGVANILYKRHDILVAKGQSNDGQPIDIYEYFFHKQHLPNPKEVNLFDTRVFRKLLTYEPIPVDLNQIKNKKIFISHARAINSPEMIEFLKDKEVWVPGINTWKKLAKKGVRVNGCCDNLGFDFMYYARQGAFFSKGDFTVLTHGSAHWETDHQVVRTYRLSVDETSPEIKKQVEELNKADFIFWSSFFMYTCFGSFVSQNNSVTHASMIGKTEELLLQKGISKVVTFPSTNEFDKWIST